MPKEYEHLYSGSTNQHGSNSVMKIHLIMEMICNRISELSISSYRRNDQTATGDIFAVAQCGYLVLRDLGYFCYDSFRKMIDKKIFSISRLCAQIPVINAETGKQINLAKEFSKCGGTFDRMVLIGKKEKIPEDGATHIRIKIKDMRHPKKNAAHGMEHNNHKCP